MSILILAAVIAAVVIAGLYVFVPEVHTKFGNAFKAAQSDYESFVTRAEKLIDDIEEHATAKATEAKIHHATAQTYVNKEVAATSESENASDLAKNLRCGVGK